MRLYSKLPCTIKSSNEIARIGWYHNMKGQFMITDILCKIKRRNRHR